MNTPNYIEIVFEHVTTEQAHVLMAVLDNYGFEGFEENIPQLKAYISEANFDTESFTTLMNSYQITYAIHTIPSQNWNALWEEQFEPVLVNDFVGIRAHFHPSLASEVEHEIVITPKMSFGTGHHATTWMMIAQMQAIDFTGKRVLDFGTGTGILAILAEKLGAAAILAIDIDEWSIDNAKENIMRNDCSAIQVQQADAVAAGVQYDIVLANINKNVVIQNMKQLHVALAEGGFLLLSGLLAEDEADILTIAATYKLTHSNTIHKQQWIAMLFTR